MNEIERLFSLKNKVADLYSIHSVLIGVSLLPLLTLPQIFTFPPGSSTVKRS